MTRRLLLVLAAVIALVLACAGPTAPHHATTSPIPGAGELLSPTPAAGKPHCGYERWKVKTGTDPLAGKVNLTPATSSIAALTALTSPLPPVKGKYPPQTARQPAEQRTVTITGTLIAYSIEQDDDFHLVILDSQAHSMIVEIPAPACVGPGSPFAAGITAARNTFVAATHYNPPEPAPGQYAPPFVNANVAVAVTGVVFFDFVHGQRGVASNGVELHPVLAITFGGPMPRPSASPSATPRPRPTHHRRR